MDAVMSSAHLSTAWRWVADYFSCSPQNDPSIIQDLIDEAASDAIQTSVSTGVSDHIIFQKKASMPISTLQQLKDAILEGTNPYASCWRAFSGPVHKNDGTNIDSETVSSGSGIQNMAPEGSNIQLSTVKGDYRQNKLLPFKRKKHSLDDEHPVEDYQDPVEDYQEGQGGVNDSDLHLDAKRFKYDANESGGQSLIQQFGNELVENEKCLGCSLEFDGKGKLYCPCCTHKQAILNYHEARRKATLATKELTAFAHAHPKRLHIRKRCDIEHSGEAVQKGVPEQQITGLYPEIRKLRRTRVPWTAEEEKILKEGVRVFSEIGSSTIPWTEILEYGRSVFLEYRTTVDLKDKWRNICKVRSGKMKMMASMELV